MAFQGNANADAIPAAAGGGGGEAPGGGDAARAAIAAQLAPTRAEVARLELELQAARFVAWIAERGRMRQRLPRPCSFRA